MTLDNMAPFAFGGRRRGYGPGRFVRGGVWPRCHTKVDGEECPGIKVEGFVRCLRHLTDKQFDQFVARLKPGAHLDVDAPFVDSRFAGPAIFSRTTFGRHALFVRSEFANSVLFNHAEFTGDAMFNECRFEAEEHIRLDGTIFGGPVFRSMPVRPSRMRSLNDN